MMTKLLEKEHIKINCPHCTEKINTAWICKMDSMIGVRYAFLCSNCQKLLGISNSKDYSAIQTISKSIQITDRNF